MRRSLLTASLFQIVGMAIGLFMLFNPNPHLLALFAFLGVPLIVIGLTIYAFVVLKEMRQKKMI